MGVFDITSKERTITSDSWQDGEEIVIKQLTYGENKEAAKRCMSKDDNGNEVLDETLIGEEVIFSSIVSWTFTKNGKVMPKTKKNFDQLPANIVEFIMKQIEDISPTPNAKFPLESGNSVSDEKEQTTND